MNENRMECSYKNECGFKSYDSWIFGKRAFDRCVLLVMTCGCKMLRKINGHKTRRCIKRNILVRNMIKVTVQSTKW